MTSKTVFVSYCIEDRTLILNFENWRNEYCQVHCFTENLLHYFQAAKSPYRGQPQLRIAPLLTMPYCSNEPRNLRCKIIHIDESRPALDGVSKDRRKILLADEANSIIAFMIRSEPVHLALDSTIYLSHFRVANGMITIHDKTLVTRLVTISYLEV